MPFRLPADLVRSYELCGGTELFPLADHGCTVVAPADLVAANPAIVGEEFPEDRSQARHGRCSDAFHDVYGVAGSMAVIAGSFTDLLDALLRNEGRRWSWLEPGWAALGDAYD